MQLLSTSSAPKDYHHHRHRHHCYGQKQRSCTHRHPRSHPWYNGWHGRGIGTQHHTHRTHSVV